MNPKFLVHIELINSGWKRTTLDTTPEGVIRRMPPADLYLDCRVIPNPFLLFGHKDGSNHDVQKWMKEHAPLWIESFYDTIIESIAQIPTRRKGKEDPWADPYRVCFMCAWGIHRSMAMKHIIAEYLNLDGYTVEVK